MQDATPPASFDIRKLYHTQKKRDNYRQEMYDSVLRKAHCRIETVAARKETACLFQIPGFLLGMPLYDPYQCCGYVLQRLKTDGFVVSYMHPNTLRIDWSRHLIEGHVQRLEAHDAAESLRAEFEVLKTEVVTEPQPETVEIFDPFLGETYLKTKPAPVTHLDSLPPMRMAHEPELTHDLFDPFF